jgi:hypothetical protein
MHVIRVLLAKDLCRARRNPLPWLINLAIPLVIVALVGLTFGGSARQNQGLGRIDLRLSMKTVPGWCSFCAEVSRKRKARNIWNRYFSIARPRWSNSRRTG